MAMYARLSRQNTACEETALCGNCLQDDDIKKMFLNPWGLKDDNLDQPHTSWVDCSGNEALQCQNCGADS
jgi:hypothetical protein